MTKSTFEELTREQRVAAASRRPVLYVEAGPGTGKTTVAAHRFGVLRFDPTERGNPKAIIAVSFTRAATVCLRQRVLRFWGPSALTWPHRIVTLDSLISEIVHDLLAEGLVSWPGGHRVLEVHDSWLSFGKTEFGFKTCEIELRNGQVHIRERRIYPGEIVYPSDKKAALLRQGTCTHNEVRLVLAWALQDKNCVARIRERLGGAFRAFIVDEVFDADTLDISVIEAVISANVPVTVVGDPWQALYVFRGAKPDLVNNLIDRSDFAKRQLVRSFRWTSRSQLSLAADLRLGVGVVLPPFIERVDESYPDVVLATAWKSLWDVGDWVLPLAFKSFGGTAEEAAATLLLDHVTKRVFGENATYLADSLTTLGISDPRIVDQLQGDLASVLQVLQSETGDAATVAYRQLLFVLGKVSTASFRAVRGNYTKRLQSILERVASQKTLVLGLSVHQAKGREWAVVGVRMDKKESALLMNGLSSDKDSDRKLYVACTRAREKTVEV